MFSCHSDASISAHEGTLLSVTLSYMLAANLEVRVTFLIGVILSFPEFGCNQIIACSQAILGSADSLCLEVLICYL
jgi:hypothetical protein